uniref:Uncharacterized protein n=1 Tax=Palpitomonas bilix TaxID=652834 RepID=A0A7S3DB69_9EUKA|mmetsp:Transcript_29422/g.75874  ORF Transcript_29422/g.75874 Transcript_29422/m.75874 type:complete len:356 (+) Transcript_29422:3-1070(+)
MSGFDSLFDRCVAEVEDTSRMELHLFRYLFGVSFLNISHNTLTSLSISSIACLSSVEHLYIQNNRLHAIPDEICALSHLRVCHADFNQLRRLPTTLGHIKKLETLSATHNPPLRSLPPEIWRSEHLGRLAVDWAFLDSPPPEVTLGYPAALIARELRKPHGHHLDISIEPVHLPTPKPSPFAPSGPLIGRGEGLHSDSRDGLLLKVCSGYLGEDRMEAVRAFLRQLDHGYYGSELHTPYETFVMESAAADGRRQWIANFAAFQLSSFPDIDQCLSFPSIQAGICTLILCYNELTTLPSACSTLERLHVLDMSFNPLQVDHLQLRGGRRVKRGGGRRGEGGKEGRSSASSMTMCEV